MTDKINKAHDTQRDQAAQHLRSAEAALVEQAKAMEQLRGTLADLRGLNDELLARLAVAERAIGGGVVDALMEGN